MAKKKTFFGELIQGAVNVGKTAAKVQGTLIKAVGPTALNLVAPGAGTATAGFFQKLPIPSFLDGATKKLTADSSNLGSGIETAQTTGSLSGLSAFLPSGKTDLLNSLTSNLTQAFTGNSADVTALQLATGAGNAASAPVSSDLGKMAQRGWSFGNIGTSGSVTIGGNAGAGHETGDRPFPIWLLALGAFLLLRK